MKAIRSRAIALRTNLERHVHQLQDKNNDLRNYREKLTKEFRPL